MEKAFSTDQLAGERFEKFARVIDATVSGYADSKQGKKRLLRKFLTKNLTGMAVGDSTLSMLLGDLDRLLREVAYHQLGIANPGILVKQADIKLLILIFKKLSKQQEQSLMGEVAELYKHNHAISQNKHYLVMANNLQKAVNLARQFIDQL